MYFYEASKLSGEAVLKCFSQVIRPNTAGDIFIDGHSIKKLDLKLLRRNIASVSQEPSLFSGNIKDNLRIGKMDASEEEIIKAATTANVHSFISKLPNGYLTEVLFHLLWQFINTWGHCI